MLSSIVFHVVPTALEISIVCGVLVSQPHFCSKPNQPETLVIWDSPSSLSRPTTLEPTTPELLWLPCWLILGLLSARRLGGQFFVFC
jgi:hypothetical protein